MLFLVRSSGSSSAVPLDLMMGHFTHMWLDQLLFYHLSTAAALQPPATDGDRSFAEKPADKLDLAKTLNVLFIGAQLQINAFTKQNFCPP